MPQFQLDTSGEVWLPSQEPRAAYRGGMRWADLDTFTQGYIEALFFTNGDEMIDNGGSGVLVAARSYLGFSDLAPSALQRILTDCQAFQQARALQRSLDDQNREAGHDFWLTRNGHGTGFWDGDWPEPYATQLTDAAKSFGEIDTYLGDDGKVYLS